MGIPTPDQRFTQEQLDGLVSGEVPRVSQLYGDLIENWRSQPDGQVARHMKAVRQRFEATPSLEEILDHAMKDSLDINTETHQPSESVCDLGVKDGDHR